MTETIQTAMDRLMTTAAEPQDYIAEDGLLYCGSCNTPKEAFFPNGRMLFGRDRHPVECQCRQEAREKQEEEERARLHHENVRRLKLQGFTDWAMQHWTFENDHGQNLKLRKPAYYQSLLLNGKLDAVLADVEEQAAERYEVLIEQMSQRESISEKLKEENQMEWVSRMRNLENRAEEIVKAELIYTFERR